MFSRTTEYALRIMAFFAHHSDGKPIRAKDLAVEVNIPVFYLSKILRRMVTAGLLRASKGHGGGFLIAKPPAKIQFRHIFEAIEGDIGIPMCVFGWDACSDKNPCVLHNRWKELKQSVLKWSTRTTLADVKGDVDNTILPVFLAPKMRR